MARYRMSDGTVVDTSNATQSWEEKTRFDGHNHVSVATGSDWEHQTLHRSRRGRFYVERTSQLQDISPRAEWVSNEEAARWLLVNEHEIPAELSEAAEQMSE